MSDLGSPTPGTAPAHAAATRDEHYAALFRSGVDFALIEMDQDGWVTGWNPGAEDMFGWTAREVLGRPLNTILAPAAARAPMDSSPRAHEGWHARKDGSLLWGRGELITLMAPDGARLGALMTMRDRTAQREAAERQRLDAEFLRGVLGSAGDCIKVLDLDGRITFMNDGGQLAMEISDFSTVRGCPWPDFWAGEGHSAAIAALEAARQGGTGRFQGAANTFAGNPRYWDVQVTPMLGAGGATERLLSVSRDITAMRLAEQALREAEGFSTLILNSSRDCIVVLDLDGHTLFISPGGIESMEISDVAPVLGLSWLRVWADDDAVAAQAAVAEARAGGIGRFRGFCPTHKDTPKWWDIVISPLPGADGRPERLVAFGRDVTGQVEAQERLSLSEETLRLTVTAADVGTWDLDLRTGRLRWSDRTKAMFGISPEMPCSMTDFYGGLHPDDRDATTAAFASALDPARRATYDVDYRTVGKEDGRVRWVSAKGRGIFDLHGTCIRALGTAIDITARKNAEARQNFRFSLWDRLQQLSDPRQIMTSAAEALCRHLGVSRVGYGLVQPDGESILLDPSFADGVAPLSGMFKLSELGAGGIARQRQGQTVFFGDVAQTPPCEAGTWEQIQVGAMVAVPLVRDGRFRASFYVNHPAPRLWLPEDIALIEDVAQRTWDAVERARAEAGLREANEVLEQRIAHALDERKSIEEALRQSQKMEAVGQLTGGLAHDFNNLLTGISGSLELMQTRLAQGRMGEMGRYVTAAQGACRRAASLTHRLLAFSRRQTLDPKPTDITRLIAGMEELIRRSVGPAVRIEIRTAPGLWTSFVDPPQLENALLNLCINARDAMPDGGRLTIATANRWIAEDATDRRDLAPGPYACLSVTDTGTGMTPEVAKRAFDPFYTTKPIGKGTGLGLSMIYGFARQSGGEARIMSEPGRGSTICLYLPRHHGAEEGVEASAPAAAMPRVEQGGVVLIVDDEPTVRMLITDVLTGMGYATIEAADGVEGLRILQSGAHVDLLVTDVGLPSGMNGRQLADAGQALRAGLKVLFITGYAEHMAVGAGSLEPGMQVLTKPFSLDDMARRVTDLIGG